MLQRSPLLHFEQRTYQMALGRDLERSTTVPERDLPAQRAACEPSDLGKTPHLRPPNGVRLSCAAVLWFSQLQFYYDGRRQLQPLVRRHGFGCSTPNRVGGST